jgi:hypothetical protein
VKYGLTKHAKGVLQEREIPVEWLERTLNAPKLIEPDPDDVELEHRLARIPEHDNRALRVVINKTVRPVLVVTVYFDRTMRKKL